MWQNVVKQAEMRLRTRMPGFLRSGYRIARAFRTVESSPPLPPEVLDGAMFCASREAMLPLLPRFGVVAELGTYRGDFARAIRRCNEPRELHLIDIDYSQFDATALDDASVTRHAGYTHEIVARFADASFDWIYIDADHSYEGCLRDALAAMAKVKPGGYLVFNDFAHIDPWMGRYGVHRAVSAFALQARWPLAFFCYEPNGLYDVAFRRPEA